MSLVSLFFCRLQEEISCWKPDLGPGARSGLTISFLQGLHSLFEGFRFSFLQIWKLSAELAIHPTVLLRWPSLHAALSSFQQPLRPHLSLICTINLPLQICCLHCKLTLCPSFILSHYTQPISLIHLQYRLHNKTQEIFPCIPFTSLRFFFAHIAPSNLSHPCLFFLRIVS